MVQKLQIHKQKPKSIPHGRISSFTTNTAKPTSQPPWSNHAAAAIKEKKRAAATTKQKSENKK
jgi:hypothetical protein